LIPRRDTVHDMGRSVTHNAIICYRSLVEKKPISVVAQETFHSAEDVERYVQCFRRIQLCRDKRLSQKEIAQATGHSLGLVKDGHSLGLGSHHSIPGFHCPGIEGTGAAVDIDSGQIGIGVGYVDPSTATPAPAMVVASPPPPPLAKTLPVISVDDG
jgi:hypothetical protein